MDLGEGPRAPLFISCILKTFLYDPNPSNRPENRFIKCCLHLLKSGGEGGGFRPLFLNFLDPLLRRALCDTSLWLMRLLCLNKDDFDLT